MLTSFVLINRGILGNHYNGNYDPIWDIDEEIGVLNELKGWQIVSCILVTPNAPLLFVSQVSIFLAC